MLRTIMLIPIGIGVGLTSVNLGVIRSIEKNGARLSIFKPISQSNFEDDSLDKMMSRITQSHSSIVSSTPLRMSYVEHLISSNKKDVLMEELLARYYESTKNAEIVLIEGLELNHKHQFVNTLNYEIARTLDAEIIFVLVLGNNQLNNLKECIELARSSFGGKQNNNITGVIINKLNAPFDEYGRINHYLFDNSKKVSVNNINPTQLIANSPLPVLGCIPWNFDLITMRTIDIARHLKAQIINEGDITNRLVKSVTFCTYSLPHILEKFRPGSLLVTSAHRPDILVSAALASINGIEIAAILLTGGHPLNDKIKKLCEPAFETGLPVLMVDTNTWKTSINLQTFNFEVPFDDYQRIQKIQDYISNYINIMWIKSLSTSTDRLRHLSPPAFRYELIKRARQARKCIVLPEGDEPRTVKAATICVERGIAKCILLGDPEKIQHVAKEQGIELKKDIKILNPVIIREKYVSRLLELRKSKGMTELIARKQLKDNVMLGTMMLEQDEVDGLVSGAIHTTANTIRPSLQLIKTAPGISIVSSVFFMLLPDDVLVYGDCAINPDPTAEQLSDIAIQSAESAIAFGIEPRIAMISYSTGNSGSGSDVDKVREATCLVQKKRPDLIIDGPLQYDAAIMSDIAKSKAPNSPVAGQATVFIFPDLNTGNTTYKAVQRSANIMSIGPVLQGMRKPVNDLSRGALVEDIVYTVAITAIQSYQVDTATNKIS